METQKQIKDMTGEEIAIALQNQYQQINQCQQNIGLINNELQQRMNALPKVLGESEKVG